MTDLITAKNTSRKTMSVEDLQEYGIPTGTAYQLLANTGSRGGKKKKRFPSHIYIRLGRRVLFIREKFEEWLLSGAELVVPEEDKGKAMNKHTTHIYIDGACSRNGYPDAVGGWGVVEYSNYCPPVESCGYEISTPEQKVTNIRMELTAAIQALKNYDNNEPIIIYSDCKHVIDGVNEAINNSKSWKSYANSDLWRELASLVKTKDVRFEWVKSHSGNEGNERANFLAQKAMKEELSFNQITLEHAINKVELYVAGDSQAGIGGIGIVRILNSKTIEPLSLSEPAPNSKRMELLACIKAVEAALAVAVNAVITVHTDSEYVVNGFNEWIYVWKGNNWQTIARIPVKNKDLWEQLDTLRDKCPLSIKLVGNPSENVALHRAYDLAGEAIYSATKKQEGMIC